MYIEKRENKSVESGSCNKMYILVLSLLILLDPAITLKSRRVNLELETILEFDKSNDIEFLETVQQFINKVKDTLTNNTNTVQNDKNDYKFTDLLEKSIEIIKTFQDDAIRNVFKAMDEEVRKFKPKNTFENDMRRYLSHKLVNIKRSPIKNIHKNLDDLLRKLREDNKDRDDNFFINFVNTLYKKDSERKYIKLFKKLNAFRRSSTRSNEELKKIIVKIVRDILIKYANLTDKNKSNLGSLFKDYIIKTSSIEDADDVRDTKENSKALQKVSKEDEEEAAIETEEKYDSLEYYKSKIKQEMTLSEDFTDNHDEFDEIDDTKENHHKKLEKINKLEKVKSTTEPAKPLKLKVKKKIKSQSDGMVLTRTSKISKKRKEISKNRVKLTHNVKYNSQSKSSQENKKLSHFRWKKTKNAPKLTHITLYPVTIEINKKKKTKFRTDVPDEKSLEINSNEEKSTANEIITNHSVEINVFVKQESKEREDKVTSTADKLTPLRYKLKKKTTSNILSTTLIKRADSRKAELPTSSASFEYFGSLYKDKTKLPIKVVTHKKITDNTKVVKNAKPTKARDMITATNKFDKVSARKTIAYNDEINRRANKAIDNHTVETKIIEDITKNTTYDKSKDGLNDTTIPPSNDNNINNTVKLIEHNETDESNNNINVSTKIEVTTNKNIVEISNTTKITTPTIVEETTFDINNYLKNSEIQNEDAEKKKEIEKLMRDDLKNLFSIATNATTTEGFTDVFKELEDAFDLN